MFSQNLLFWQHLIYTKKLTRVILVAVALILAGPVLYLWAVDKNITHFRFFLALPIIIFAFLYGLAGGAISSLAIAIFLYIIEPDIGASRLTAIILIGLLPGILKEGLNWEKNHLEALRRIDLAILSRLSLREATNVVVDETIKLLGVDDVTIFLYDRDKDELVKYHDFRVPPPPDFPMPFRLKPGQAIAGIVFNQKAPVAISDLWADPRVLYHEPIKKMGLRSLLAVPLLVGRAPVGVFVIFTKSKRSFSGREVEVVERLAGQLAIALEAARHEKEAGEKAARLSVLYTVDSAILAQKPLPDVLNLAARLAAELMKADSSVIGLIDEKEQVVSVKAQYGCTEEELRIVEQVRVKVGEGAWGWAILQKEPVAMPDVQKDPRFTRFLPFTKISSLMAAPLVSDGGAIGAISVRYRERRSFTEEEVEFFNGFAGQIAIAIKQAEFIDKIKQASLETIKVLMITLDARDPYTAGHSERVARYAVTIAARMGLSQEELQLMEYAGLLHDVGKIGCAEEAWQKPGKLDDGEMAEMKKHSYVSSQILKSITFLKETAPWVYHHHERFDGLGYPDRLKGTEIPLESRILLVADAYDAMTSSRPYRAALGKERALAELGENAGKQFDPQVVYAALEVLT